MAYTSGCTNAFSLLLSTGEYSIGPREMRELGEFSDPCTRQVAVNSFAGQRKRLWQLVEHYLTKAELNEIRPDCTTGLSFRADRASQLLHKKGVDVAVNLRIPYGDIEGNLEMAQMLWDAGFHDVDELDDDGYTTLMRCGSFDFANWLIDHGANIHYRRSGVPALHHLIESVYSIPRRDMKRSSNQRDELSTGSLRCTRLILEDQCKDACRCPCSANGCLPVTRFLEECIFRRFYSENFYKRHDFNSDFEPLYNLRFWMRMMGSELVESFNTNASAIIRLLTFEDLQIPHVCHHWGKKDAEEIQEILDERKDQLELLEELVDDFVDIYEKSSCSLWEFLVTIWNEKMEYELASDQSPDERGHPQLRGSTVVLEAVNFPRRVNQDPLCAALQGLLDRNEFDMTRGGSIIFMGGIPTGFEQVCRRVVGRKIGPGLRRQVAFPW
jgi:hypothetical protein